MAAATPIARRVVVVAGAASPAGDAIARAAASAGARVLLIDAGETALGEAVRAINNAGGISDYAVAASGHAGALAAAGRVAVARFGRVDAWIDAAATDPDRIAATWAAALPLLRHAGGSLVLVAPPGLSVEVDRRALAAEAPLVALSLIVAASAAEPDRVAGAAVRSLLRPQSLATVQTGFASRHRGLIATVGLGGLALAAGGLALLRRRRRDG